MRKFKHIFAVLVATSTLIGCADAAKKNEQAQSEQQKMVREMPAVETPQDIVMRAASIFEGSPDLSDEQKSQLHEIYTGVYDESMAIRREIGDNKTLLYMTLVKKDYKSSEVNKLTKKIVSLDKKRLDIMFKALKDVQKIVGRGAAKESLYKQLGSIER